MVAHNKAVDMYLETVSELAETAGINGSGRIRISLQQQTVFLRDSPTAESAHCATWLLMPG